MWPLSQTQHPQVMEHTIRNISTACETHMIVLHKTRETYHLEEQTNGWIATITIFPHYRLSHNNKCEYYQFIMLSRIMKYTGHNSTNQLLTTLILLLSGWILHRDFLTVWAQSHLNISVISHQQHCNTGRQVLNNLQSYLRHEISYGQFNRQLKTFLFGSQQTTAHHVSLLICIK